jgi:acyl-CoA reductase-like NAD-dependent aldehyde dehydrogenase
MRQSAFEIERVGYYAQVIERARRSKSAWAVRPMSERIALLGHMRRLMASEAEQVADRLTQTLPQRRTVAETLAAEVLPLLDGWRYLEKHASSVLRPRRLGAVGRPLWLWGAHATVEREPLGTVLLLCPFNYPLLLSGAPMGQALAAGNAVLLKPGRHGAEACEMLAECFRRAGGPVDLVQVLDVSVEAGFAAIDAGVDHVVLTGSADSGRAVLSRCAERLIPATLELSGCDSVFVQRDADLDHVVRCLKFGLAINSGATCIAPRRVWVNSACQVGLVHRLVKAVRAVPPLPADSAALQRLLPMVERAQEAGATLLAGEVVEPGMVRPFLLDGVHPNDPLVDTDLFAPVLSLVSVESDAQALAYDAQCRLHLAASVFGPPADANALASQVHAGLVTVNDLIAPSADPRLPFGGRGESGFGVTRGQEGLLQMTRPRAVVHHPARFAVHLTEPQAGDDQRLAALIRVLHGGWRDRLAACRALFRPVAPDMRNHP